LLDKLQDGLIDDTDFKGRHQTLKTEITALESTRERLTAQVSRQDAGFVAMQASFNTILTFWQGWETLTEDGQTKRLQAIIEDIRVTREYGEIDKRKDFRYICVRSRFTCGQTLNIAKTSEANHLRKTNKRHHCSFSMYSSNC